MSASAPAPAAAPSRGVHVLKSVSKSFQATWTGDKRHEVRRYDRPFVVGDVVLLLDFSPVLRPTGAAAGPLGWWGPRVILGEITHLTAAGAFGLPPSLCVFTVGKVVLLQGAEPHDDTRPPLPSPSAREHLPADILAAWSGYNPRQLRPAFAPPTAVSGQIDVPNSPRKSPPPVVGGRGRRPSRKKTPARKKGARRR